MAIERTNKIEESMNGDAIDDLVKVMTDSMGRTTVLIDNMSKITDTVDTMQKSIESLHDIVKSQQNIINKMMPILTQLHQQVNKPASNKQSQAACNHDPAVDLAARAYLWKNNPFLALFLGPK